jgi:hypothetical protein
MIDHGILTESAFDLPEGVKRAIMFVIDGEAVQIFTTDDRFAAILTSNPLVLDVTGRTISKTLNFQGVMYDEENDIIIPPQPFPSWTFDEKTEMWNAPVSKPKDEGIDWAWSEELEIWYDRSVLKGMEDTEHEHFDE